MNKFLKISFFFLLTIGYQAYGKQNHHSNSHIEDQYKEAIASMQSGKTKIVEKLINSKGFDPNFQYSPGTPSLLMAATLGGHVEIVRKLIFKGANVNAYSLGYQPLRLPGQEDEGVKQLGEWSTPLIKAAGNGDDEIVRLLLGAGAYVNAESEYGYRAVDVAFLFRRKNWRNCLYQLINAENFNPDLLDKNGDTLLDRAISNGDLDLSSKLLYIGAKM